MNILIIKTVIPFLCQMEKYSNEYQYDLISNYLYKDRKRYIWERFHFPYWKFGFLNYIHRLTAVPLQLKTYI